MTSKFVLLCLIMLAAATCENGKNSPSSPTDGNAESPLETADTFPAPEPEPDVINGPYKAIDLGLSVRWCDCNIGAQKPWDSGLYFAWAETTGHIPAESHSFSANSYSQNFLDADMPLSLDAAKAYLRGQWRVPTGEQMNELCSLTWTWIPSGTKEYGGVAGVRVEGKNGNHIFLPASGYYEHTDLYKNGSRGYYWSSTFDHTGHARYLLFGSGAHLLQYESKWCGFPIRAVYPKN